jgi:hypothetical protein
MPKSSSPSSRSVELREVQQLWSELGARDPMWAVLSIPGKKGNRWGRDEFFATGVADVAASPGPEVALWTSAAGSGA